MMLFRFSFLAILGIVAAKVLLNGARQLKSKSRQWKRYEKPGSLATAVREFYKLKPTNVKRHDLPNGVRNRPFKFTARQC